MLAGDFNPDAAAAGTWTARVLDGKTRAFLSSLAPEEHADGVDLYHASPRDPVWEYVLSEEAAEAAFGSTAAPIVLVGHSHVPLAIVSEDGRIAGGHAPRWHRGRARPRPLAAATRAPSASLATATRARRGSCSISSAAVPRSGASTYDIAATQAEIRADGLPASLAERLALGL